MMQPLVRWMRVVLPRGEFLLIPVGFVIFLEVLHALTALRNGPVAAPDIQSAFRLTILTFSSLAYGILRALWFHPALRVDYRRWLEYSPWTPRHPLPEGPLTLVPQDLVVMGILIGLHHELTEKLILLPIFFLFGYLVCMMVLNRLIGEWQLAYAVAFGLGLLALAGQRPEYALGLLVLCYFPTYWAIQRSLHRFPWTLHELFEGRSFKIAAEQMKERKLGWPYDVLTVQEPKLRIPRADGICVSFLVGWYQLITLIALSIDPDAQQVLRNGGILLTCFSAPFFAAMYFENHVPPISVLGRLLTFRWIIPSFDRIWAIPLATAALCAAAQHYLPMYWNCLALTGYLLVVSVVGPHLERWRLIGQHRAIFMWNPAVSGKDFIEL